MKKPHSWLLRWSSRAVSMKLYVAVLVLLVCLALPVYAPEAQDTAGGSQDPIDDLTTVAARQEALAVRLSLRANCVRRTI